MKAKLKNDPARERGWARLELTFDQAETPRPAAEENFTLSVQKIPEQSFLQPPGGDRWPRGGAERYLEPDAQSWDGRTLALELGPDFTSAMAKTPCCVSLKGSRGAAFSKIRVDTLAIDLPPADYKITIDPQKLAEEERKKLAAEEERKREEERLRQEEEQRQAELARQQAESAKAEAGEPEVGKSSQKWLIVLIAVLLLALAGGLAWYFLIRPKAPEPVVEPAPVTEARPGDEPVEPPAAETPAPNVSINAGSGEAKIEVQNLFRRGAPYAELEEALAKYDGQEGAEDAVFLLALELAPVKPEYRSRLAAFFDPSDPRPAGSITKNAATAYDEYEAAKKAGDAGAAAAQARLLGWARANAATEPSAADLLNR